MLIRKTASVNVYFFKKNNKVFLTLAYYAYRRCSLRSPDALAFARNNTTYRSSAFCLFWHRRRLHGGIASLRLRLSACSLPFQVCLQAQKKGYTPITSMPTARKRCQDNKNKARGGSFWVAFNKYIELRQKMLTTAKIRTIFRVFCAVRRVYLHVYIGRDIRF